MTRRLPTPQCPIRLGEPCTLCFPGATGPQDCGLVYLVESDDREDLVRICAEFASRGELIELRDVVDDDDHDHGGGTS